mgnify:CR=1 FL=1
MKNKTQIAAEYLENVAKWLEITKGIESLKMLLTEEGLKQAMLEYNEAYKKFFEKYMNSPEHVKEIIVKKMCGEVYFKIRTEKEFQTLCKNNRECLNMIEA